MSKELPYFKFYPSEWFEGDITLENEKTQGLFVLICAWYWKKDCVIDIKFVNQRLIKGKATLKQCLNILIDKNIIKVDDSQRIIIEFLDEQYDELSEFRQKKVEAGRKGGKASVKQRLSKAQASREVDKNIKERKEEFKSLLKSYVSKYDNDMMDAFYDYWTEHGINDKKMRFEKEKTFGLPNRLATWKKNELKFNKTKTTGYNPDQW